MMNLLKDALLYFFKKFPVFLLVMTVPAVATAFTVNPFNALIFLIEYSVFSPASVQDIFVNIFGKVVWWRTILQFLILCAAISILVSVVERNLKSGRYGIRHPIKRLNDSVTAVIPLMVFYAVILLASYYILGGFVSLLHSLLSGIGNTPTVLNIVITSVAVIGYYALVAQIFKGTMLTTPCNLITGYTLTESFSYSIKLSQNKSPELYFACFFVVIVGYVINFITYIFKLPYYIGTAVTNFIVVSYFVSLMMTAYFNLTNTERHDGKKAGRL